MQNWQRLAAASPKMLRAAVRHPSLLKKVISFSQYGYEASSLSALYRLDACSRIRKHIDIVHAHFGPVARQFQFLRRLWNAPFVVSFHGYDFTTTVQNEGRNIYGRLFAEADLISANSQFTMRKLVELGCPVGKIRTLPVGFDPKRFPFKPRTAAPGKPVQILSIGRLAAVKGHEYVIRAVALLREKGALVEYDIVGDGELRTALQSLAERLGVGSHVRFHGALVGEPLNNVIMDAHLFVMCSVRVGEAEEGQGLALQEAQAAGLPVVATAHGALPEGFLPNVSGFLVPEGDVSALAKRLEFLVNNSAIWPRLGRAGHEFAVTRYDIHKLISTWNRSTMRLGNSLLAKPKPADLIDCDCQQIG